MIEQLKQIDTSWFITVNNHWQNGLFDLLCPFMRAQKNWYLLYALLVYFIFRDHGGKKTVWLVVVAAITVVISDQLSANLIKHLVERLRPCNDPSLRQQVRLLVDCGSGYSFVSTHATNHFAIAIYFSSVLGRSRKWFLPAALIWAALIAFSQVYVGVHYPFDVICGALLGVIIGLLSSFIINRYILKEQQQES